MLAVEAMAKKPIEMTDEEALKKLFPKKVREEPKRVAHERDPRPKNKPEK